MTVQVQSKRPIKPRELLAIMPEAIQGKPGAMFWDSYVSVPYNAMEGTVAIVSIRGSLDHHPGWGCDSYEAILQRTRLAFEGVNDRPSYYQTEEERQRAPMPPTAVVLRIDSPGGVVSGLNETVFALQRMSEEFDIPLIAYADELAASAAYALACACEEIACPESAYLGSIGVIAALYDQTAADEKMGHNVVVLTSGARKADGHPHVPITEGALSAEQERIDKSAAKFWVLAADARELPVATVRKFEAGIFDGEQAVKVGIADAVMGFDALLQLLNSDAYKQNYVADRKESGPPSNAKGTPMSKLALTNQLTRVEAALKDEKAPSQRAALTASRDALQAAINAESAAKEAMKKTKIKYEETSLEKPDEPTKEESEDADKEAKTPDDCDDDDEKDDDEDAKTSAAASLAVAERVTGRKGARAVAALEARLAHHDILEDRLSKLEKQSNDDAKENSISAALSERRITPNEANTLRAKKASYVREYIADRKGKVVHTDGDEDVIRPATGGANAETLPPEVEAEIQSALGSIGNLTAEARTNMESKLRAAHMAEHKKRMMAGLNGASGRV